MTATVQVAPPHAGFTTLGCKVNVYETELIKETLAAAGWRTGGAEGNAGVHIINTCTVTREADRQARQAVRRAVRRNPDALIIVTGCYAQMDPEACAAIPGVDLVLGNGRKLDVHKLLPALAAGTLPPVLVGDAARHSALPPQLLGGYEGRSRAFLQVQQGCDQGCTFCIIHKARGAARSLPAALVKRQAQRLLMNGYKELVVCGVDLGSWGADLAGREGLAGLLAAITALPGDFRVRLSSLDPVHIDEPLLRLWARDGKLCPHLHLSMQSASTLILKRMRRRYTREVLYERVRALRDKVPGLAISADVMVGFPTESAAHFAETLEAITGLGIAWPHVFPYSPRPGTAAARIGAERQVAASECRARAAAVRAAGARVRRALFEAQSGRVLRVLVEGRKGAPPGCVMTRAANYLPVYAPGAHSAAPGHFMDIRIRDCAGEALYGDACNPDDRTAAGQKEYTNQAI